MARVNVYLPDDLAVQARVAGLNLSSLTQEAVRRSLLAARTDAWLDETARLPPTGVAHDSVIAAVNAAKDELDG